MIEATLIDSMGTDLTVVNAARVSFNKKSSYNITDGSLKDGDRRLIKYLAEHEHTSPFGHCFASFHVKAPVFVARQLVKHKFLRWNEVSRRYVDSEPEFYHPDWWRARSEDKKQGSGDPLRSKDELEVDWQPSLEAYNYLLDKGVCPEQARMVLPQSLMTEWYWSGSLDAFADMYNLRAKPDTQHETRIVATQIGNDMARLYPYSWEALTNERT